MFCNLTPPKGDGRYIADHQDIAFMLGMNVGSGSDGASTGRIGDVVCLRLTSTTTGGADTYSKTFGGVDSGTARTVLGGFKVKECETGVAPTGLCIGAWHDGNVTVGSFGRIQCQGFDPDATIRTTGTVANDVGASALATTAEPYVLSNATVTPGLAGAICTIVELVANLTASTTQQGAVYWRT